MQSILPQNGNLTIDLDDVRSILAVPNDQPFSGMSGRYQLFSTDQIVERASSLGLVPTAAFYQKARRPNRGGDEVRRHCIRMSRTDDVGKVHDRPEIVIINSHNGSSALEIQMGIFRIVCSNGLVLKGADYGGAKFYHRKTDMDKILDTLDFMVNHFDRARQSMADFATIDLNDHQRELFAKGARAIYNNHMLTPRAIDPLALLVPKRYEDSGHDLWSTFNVVQENMMKGGILLHGRDENRKGSRSAKTRAIREIVTANSLNGDLWEFASNWFKGETDPEELVTDLLHHERDMFAISQKKAPTAPTTPSVPSAPVTTTAVIGNPSDPTVIDEAEFIG